ncbi:hypothetical protein O181_026746 [Austropuccinia psidii MF-1]|uniref:Uncharacterized protein n=1 Tax=Austropuccinia psidii MF-1 TaxID=1389203 RepID=A0A9Q3H0T0_9BASI|nr:hypothetical protein [Austropuccinia psidii MF-1]
MKRGGPRNKIGACGLRIWELAREANDGRIWPEAIKGQARVIWPKCHRAPEGAKLAIKIWCSQLTPTCYSLKHHWEECLSGSWITSGAPYPIHEFTPVIPVGMRPQECFPTAKLTFGGMPPYIPHPPKPKEHHGAIAISTSTIAPRLLHKH